MLAASFALVVEILESLAFLANACNLVLYLRQYMHMSPSYILVSTLLAITCFERSCQVYVHLQHIFPLPFKYLLQASHLWVSLAFSIFINCLFFCSQELLAAVEDEKCMR
ncbi:Protein NRT1/ PTR FAMILY 4.6 [Glycine soja]